MAFALFPHDDRHHLLRRASAYVTLCGLRVKGRVQGVGQRLPPVVVTIEQPPGVHALCEECNRVRGLETLRRMQAKRRSPRP